MFAVAEWGKPKKILHCQCVEDCQSFVGFRTLGVGVQYMTMLEFEKKQTGLPWNSIIYIYLLNNSMFFCHKGFLNRHESMDIQHLIFLEFQDFATDQRCFC